MGKKFDGHCDVGNVAERSRGNYGVLAHRGSEHVGVPGSLPENGQISHRGCILSPRWPEALLELH